MSFSTRAGSDGRNYKHVGEDVASMDAAAPIGSTGAVLLIDDEARADDPLVLLLNADGWRIDLASTGAEGVAMARAAHYTAIVLDLRLPDVYGLSVLARLIDEVPGTPVVVATGHYFEAESESLALKMGAAGFLQKPVMAGEFVQAIASATVRSRPAPARIGAPGPPRSGQGTGAPRHTIVAESASMRGVLRWADSVARTSLGLLILGETGTGKEVLARTIHHRSHRAAMPFVPVNCAALPEALLAEELFGHRRGSFTGAVEDREGLLAAADGGTLFLDEIADMPTSTQVYLLRALEGGEVRRIGDNFTRRVDVRLISATNKVLGAEVAIGRFRQDLYFRLAGATCHIPPLRSRPEDLDALVGEFLRDSAARSGTPPPQVGHDVMAALKRHPWPGNIRELRNVVEYAHSQAISGRLSLDSVTFALSQALPSAPFDARPTSDDVHGTILALQQNRWNHRRAAESLGISRSTLWRRVRRLGLSSAE